MFDPTNNAEEFQTDSFHILSDLEQESKQLEQEKINLLDIETRLQARISEEIEIKKQRNDELRKELEILKRKCEELTQILNKQTAET